ncbi:MAG: ATP-binding protein [Myxococcota bacterium]
MIVAFAILAPLLAFAVSLPDAPLRSDPLLLVLVGVAAVSFGVAPLVMRWSHSLMWSLLPLVGGVIVVILALVVVDHPRALAGMLWLPVLPVVGVIIGRRRGLLLAMIPTMILLGVAIGLPKSMMLPYANGLESTRVVSTVFILAEVLFIALSLVAFVGEADASVEQAVEAGRDVKRARLSAAQSDRMAAVGLLATGVAHGVNDPLTAALDAANQLELHLAGGEVPDAGRMRKVTSELSFALQQIQTTLSALDAFSRPMPGEVANVLDLEELVRSVLVGFKGTISDETQVLVAVDTSLPVEGQRAEMAHVLLAIIRNAAQSRGPGRAPVTIHITGGLTPDAHVLLEIRDNGDGMDAATLEQAFNPFFTTRPAGEGVGLGLSAARTAVRRAGGTLELKSRVGHGTTVRLRLPAARMPELAYSRSTATPAVLQRARILVVDDEPLPLRVAGRALSDRFIVVLESRPENALARVLAGERFDLIITDVMMPNLSGDELYSSVVEDRPDLADRFLFVTGAVLGPLISSRIHGTGCPILRKPFAREDLVRVVSNLLHERTMKPDAIAPL